jgi:hypothetical protein
MDLNTSLLGRLAFAAALTASADCSSAAISVFTTQSNFLAAVSAPGVDTFSDLPLAVVTSPVARTAGPYPYSASSTTGFFGAGTASNPALSTNADTDVITFFALGAGANAIGGLFFGTNTLGSLVSATMVLTVTDSLGTTSTQTFAAAAQTFIGFVSTGTIVSLVVGTSTPGEFIFPTVDNLTIALAGVTAVPELETWSLLLAGLAALSVRARRRHRG